MFKNYLSNLDENFFLFMLFEKKNRNVGTSFLITILCTILLSSWKEKGWLFDLPEKSVRPTCRRRILVAISVPTPPRCAIKIEREKRIALERAGTKEGREIVEIGGTGGWCCSDPLASRCRSVLKFVLPKCELPDGVIAIDGYFDKIGDRVAWYLIE